MRVKHAKHARNMRLVEGKNGLMVAKITEKISVFPHPEEGDVAYVVFLSTEFAPGHTVTSAEYFRNKKAAKHYLNRYPDGQMKCLVYVQGGWVSVPD